MPESPGLGAEVVDIVELIQSWETQMEHMLDGSSLGRGNEAEIVIT